MEVLIGGSVATVVGLYIIKIGLKKVWNLTQYKIGKHKIYYQLQKNISNLNHEKFLENIDKLKAYSAHHNKNKYYSFKKKEKINDTIIQDPILFRMKYDPNYLVEINRSKMNSSNNSENSSNQDIKIWVQEKIEETIRLKEQENRLDL